FIDVPIVFLSIRWWNTIHPNVVQKGGGGLDATMKTAMFVCLGVFTVIYIALLVRKLRIINLEKRIDALEL
ncbi:MAG: cytochrome C assembly protein, partial [Mucispirillum sp.]|nr:cytochrome C assembly protein [Mucispirillum sp.]